MFQFRLLAGVVTAAGLLAAMPATAAVKIARFTGTVVSGYDETGVFAAPFTDLAGYSWVATYTYDKTLGGYLETDGVSYEYSIGGFNYGFPVSPIISASITINGVTRSVGGTSSARVYTSNLPYVSHYAQDESNNGLTSVNNYIQIFNDPIGAPASLDQNFGPVAATNGYGWADWATYDYTTGTYTELASAYLGTDAVYSVGNAVPEPASWALMIAGFGLVGTALRRRRALASVTA